ncbi:DUF6415 family natural product biosynthesis protein [Streptomyces olivoreticuli]
MPTEAEMRERTQWRADRSWLTHSATPRTAASPTLIEHNRRNLQRIAERWVPVARRRRGAAAGSVADQARWDALIDAVISAQDISPDGPYEALVLLTMQVRALLLAIHHSAPPCVPVAVIAERITDAIEAGIYPAGSRLVLDRLATDLNETRARVKLAVADLVTSGLVEWRGSRPHVTTPGAQRTNMPERLAARIRAQIAVGVYPPGTPLPTRHELARTFMVSLAPLSAALRLLADDGLVLLPYASRATVAKTAEAAQVPTAGMDVILASRDGQSPCPDTRPIVIRECARIARSWWKNRFIPHPATLDHQLNQLHQFARHLLHQVQNHGAALPPDSGESRSLHQVIARAAEADAVPRPADLELRVWHGACLATAVTDLLTLTEAATHAA